MFSAELTRLFFAEVQELSRHNGWVSGEHFSHDGTTNHFEYSCCGLDWTRDRLNRVTTFGRDALRRTISVTDPENRLVEFRYNAADQITNLITWVGGQQRVKRFDYTATNGFSRLTRVTTPMGKLTRYDYTFRGGLAWRQDGNGNVTKYQYDVLGRLVSVSDSNNNALVEMTYDVLGNVLQVRSTNSVFDYTYDGLNRVTNAICLLTNLPGFVPVRYRIAYAFDAVGNLTNRLIVGLTGFTNRIQTRYEYDVMNRLTNVVQWVDGQETGRAGYQYDLAGRLWKKSYGNGDVVTHGYDAEGRLLSLGITNGTMGVLWYAYQWDAAGNILAITNNGTNVTLYGYDRAGQLTNEIVFTNGVAGMTTNSWQYDEAGNWLNADGSGRWVYNTDNELMARVPTAAATNLTVTVTGEVEPGPRSNKWYNTWAECRGVSARVSQVDGTFSLPGVPLYPGTNALVVRLRDVSGNEAEQVRTVVRTNTLETFQYDGNGNITALINAADKNVAARYEYSPYGELLRATGPLARSNPFRWSTKFWDEESGLVYYGFRFFSPSLGRWINRDPTTDQIFLNFYLFCGNSPLCRFDVDGRSWADLWSFVEAVGVIVTGAGTSALTGWVVSGFNPAGAIAGAVAGGIGGFTTLIQGSVNGDSWGVMYGKAAVQGAFSGFAGGMATFGPALGAIGGGVAGIANQYVYGSRQGAALVRALVIGAFLGAGAGVLGEAGDAWLDGVLAAASESSGSTLNGYIDFLSE